MNLFKIKQRDYKPMTLEEIDANRIKVMLSFDEEEIVSNKDSYELVKYLNKKGEEVDCKILLKRPNGEIIVENFRGVRVCLTEDRIIK
jgi:hypothetical protein